MKTLHNDLFPETLLVDREGDRVFTTSLKVAEHFKKRHSHVLRAIENLFGDTSSQPNFGPADARHFALIEEFRRLNFQPATYLDAQKKPREMCRLTHDGFAYLCMGFTGPEAAVWKIKFLAAFRDMERQLLSQKEREANALYDLRPKWKAIVEHPELPRQQLIGLTGHKSTGSITACRRRMRQVGLLT